MSFNDKQIADNKNPWGCVKQIQSAQNLFLSNHLFKKQHKTQQTQQL